MRFCRIIPAAAQTCSNVTALVAAGLFGAALLIVTGNGRERRPELHFFLIMLAITCVAAAANAYHPIAWRGRNEFAIGAPIVVGVLAGRGLAFHGLAR